MAKPMIHAQSSARKFGGQPEDYLEIHDFMDSSKAVFPDNRHRALTHNSWFIFVVEKVFGHEIRINLPHGADLTERYKMVSVREIVEQHILEDFGGKYIPTPGDYLEHMDFQPWFNNGIQGCPTSHRKIAASTKTTTRRVIQID